MRHEERVRQPTRSVPRWRLQPWPNDPSIGHLIFTDQRHVPDAAEVAAMVADADRRGFTTLRTSAMFPPTASMMLVNGFEPVDELLLLHLELDGVVAPTTATMPLRPWHLRSAAKVDRAAFGPSWGYDSSTLADIRHATPQARGRCVMRSRRLAGFAVTGRADDVAYLQRLAVDPTLHRQGIARELVHDAIGWAQRRCRCMLVNTGVDNVPALNLYRSLGFSSGDTVLIVADLHRPEVRR